MTLYAKENRYVFEFDLEELANQNVKGRYRGPSSIHKEGKP